MTELETLKNRMLEMVKWRDREVDFHLASIQQINKTFDRNAVNLARQIKKLEGGQKNEIKHVPVRNVLPRMSPGEGLDDYIPEEDREHYLRLRAAGKCR